MDHKSNLKDTEITTGKKPSNRTTILLLVMIMLVSTALFVLQTTEKTRYHEDEVMTYILANSAVDGCLHPELMTAIDVSVPFAQEMNVHAGNQFQYDHAIRNQIDDVHPPLYYIVIHTLSSFFPDTFSPWIGYSVNLVIMLLSIVMIYLCSMHLFADKKTALAVAALFAVCPAVLNIDIYIRMYMMLMFFCIALLEWLLASLKSPRYSISAMIRLVLIIVAGALTHYYFILFVALFSIAYVLYLLTDKKFRSAILYSVLVFVSGGLSILLFPTMLTHIFSGYRGTEAFGNIIASNYYFYRIFCFWGMMEQNLFSYLGFATLLAGVILLICKRKKLRGMMHSEFTKKYLFIAVPTVVFFFFVVKTAAYYEPRYISPIYPCMILLTVVGIYKVANRCISAKRAYLIVMAFVSVFCIGSTLFGNLTYLMKDGSYALETAQKYSDYDCAYVYYYDGLWKADCNYEELLCQRSTTFICENEIRDMGQTDISKEDAFILYVGFLPYHNYDAAVNSVIRECPNINNSEFLYEWRYTRVYLLTK